MDCLDELLGLPSIPDGLPHRPYRTAKCGITDELVGPDLFTQFMLGHDTITMFYEIHQDFEGFRPEFDGFARARENMELGIEHTLAKCVDHHVPLGLPLVGTTTPGCPS
jgi:hypothetical protein